MSYVQGTDFISDTTEVRRLARRVLPADFTDDQIKVYQYEVYSGIRTLSDKDDWDSGDREFGAYQLAEKEIAALELRKHFTQDEAAIESIDRSIDAAWARLRLNVVGEGDTETGAGTGSVLSTQYKSWNLNSGVAPPNRLVRTDLSETETFAEPDF